jgi:hypothetical protein
MILKRIATQIRRQDWFTVFVELLVVVFGLSLAFQIDRWREFREDRQLEATYIDRLIRDIDDSVPDIESAIEAHYLRRDFVELLIDVSVNPEAANQYPVVFMCAVIQSSYTHSPALTAHTFDDLRSTGNMSLIIDQNVKDALYNYYGFEQTQWQFRPLQIAQEFRHFELASGVLNHEQALYVHNNWFIVNQANIDKVRAASYDLDEIQSIVERLRSRPELIDWLSSTHELQVDQIRVSEIRLELALLARKALTDYAGKIENGL